MTQFLPPNLLALFAPRDPVPYLPPLDKLPHEKHHNQPYCGIAPYIREFEDPRDAPPPTRAETREERMERKRREKIERRQQDVENELKIWDPHNDQNAQGDAFKTLFVARVNYDTTESKLRREFEVYGPIKRIHMVYNKRSGKPRGYAFIEYEHERDMHSTIVMAIATAGLQLNLMLPFTTSHCMVGIRVCMMGKTLQHLHTQDTAKQPLHLAQFSHCKYISYYLDTWTCLFVGRWFVFMSNTFYIWLYLHFHILKQTLGSMSHKQFSI